MAKCDLKLSLVLSFFVIYLAHDVTGEQYQYRDNDTPYPEEEGVNREGKIFNSELWEGVEKGLRDTAGIFSRVSDNLETTFDQISDNFGDSLFSFADRIEDRVEESLPPYLRQKSNGGPHQPFSVDAIGGSFGGVDDGLEIYYPGHDSTEDLSRTAPAVHKPSLFSPRPGGSNPVVKRPIGGIFNLFNPFKPFGHPSMNNRFNRRKPWCQSDNVCVDREEIDEDETNKNDESEIADEVETERRVEAEVEIEKRLDAEDEAEFGGESKQEVEAEDESETTDKTPNKGFFNFYSGMEISSCTDSGEKYTCVTSTSQRGIHKTVKVTYRCCHGFVRDGSGCTQVDLDPMPETLQKLDSTSDFFSLVKSADLVDQLVDTNLTIFVPTDEAIQEYTSDLEEQNEIHNNLDGMRNVLAKATRETVPILLSHMTEGFVYAAAFVDEQTTVSFADSSLRINIYKGNPSTVTVNCARIVKANQHSLNGVVHTIDRMLEPVTRSIADIILSDPQFTILKKLFKDTDLLSELYTEDNLTFFAPTDAAFRRIDPLTLESLLEGNACRGAILKQHILPNTICSSAIQGKMKTVNKLDDFLVVQRDEDDKLFVGGAQVVARDIVATNGVVHIIDDAIMPNEAKSVGDVLKSHNLTKFIELLEMADLLDEFNAQKDITVFAPSNEAIQGLSKDQINVLQKNPAMLRERLRYHVTTPSITARNINNNHLADTSAGKPLRMNLYSNVPLLSGLFNNNAKSIRMTAGCSRVSLLDSRACGAVVHIIEGVLDVPKSNIMEVLDDSKFSVFKKMVLDTGIDQELSEEGPFTLLVPSDHAFKTLPEEELIQILEDEELKEKIVRSHIMNEHICCSGINPSHWIFMDRKRTIDGSKIHIRRTHNGRLMAGPARITECGFPTSNGIVHTVNRMILPDHEKTQLVTPAYSGPQQNFRQIPIPIFKNIFFMN